MKKGMMVNKVYIKLLGRNRVEEETPGRKPHAKYL